MKHVKKSMFISTVLMVVMLIAALSTATFAWYTSNNTAATTATKVGAATSSSANIGIGFFRGAQSNEIQFHSLLDGENKGYLNPVVPVTYYDPYNQGDQTLADHYTASTSTQTAGFVANAFLKKDDEDPAKKEYANYRRIVDLNDEQVSQIVAQEDYIHSYNDGILTNIVEGTSAGQLNGNYEMIYYIPYYVYNNDVAVNAQTAPIAADDAITVSNNIYTKVSSNPGSGTKVYKVQRVFEVKATGANTEEEIEENTTAVTQDLANKLSRNANFIPYADTYLVLYYDYAAAPYTTTASTIDENAVFVGYAGTTAATLNLDQFDIQAEDVIWHYNDDTTKETYPKITEIKYNNGFAYLYKTHTGGSHNYAQVSNKDNNAITWSNFAFNKAPIDNVGFFKQDGAAASIGAYYTGNSQTMSDTHYDIGVLTGISATASQNATETFFVTNNGSTAITTLTVALNVQGDNASLLRIALFKNGVYYGTLASANEAPTTFGQIMMGAKAADMPTYKAANQINLGALATGSANAAEFQLVAWFDGKLLNDVAAGKNCSFTLTFTAA